MGSWTLPAELDQPLPRAIKRKRIFVFMISLQLGMSLFFALLIGGAMGSTYYAAQTLKERGVRAAGSVTRLYTSNGGKGRTNYNVAYTYPLGPGQTYFTTDQVNIQRFYALHVGDDVPIAYDPLHPQRARLNFDDIVFTRDNTQTLLFAVLIIGVSSSASLLVVLFLARTYTRQKRLLQWGRAAAATIVSDEEYNAGKQGRKSAVTFTFTDESGRVLHGKRIGLPPKGTRRGPVYSEMFGDPTVVYDPNDSSKNMLYPFDWIECVQRPQSQVFSA